MNNIEVITTKDKDQRDRLYQDLKKNGNDNERRVVKFSDVEEIPPPESNSEAVNALVARFVAAKKSLNFTEADHVRRELSILGIVLKKLRNVVIWTRRRTFVSTWSVAYPKS